MPAPARSAWTEVCAVDDIWPDSGVCARVGTRHVAVFRVGRERFHAVDNIDPASGASVLARGLVGSLGGRVVVASPLNKQHYDLDSGECLEAPAQRLAVHAVRVQDGRVWVAPA